MPSGEYHYKTGTVRWTAPELTDQEREKRLGEFAKACYDLVTRTYPREEWEAHGVKILKEGETA